MPHRARSDLARRARYGGQASSFFARNDAERGYNGVEDTRPDHTEVACGRDTPHRGPSNFNGTLPAGDAPIERYLRRTTRVGAYPPNKFAVYDQPLLAYSV
jgi:hypothetical protein